MKEKGEGIHYIRSLDGLRAMAAILVVLFHSPLTNFHVGLGWSGVNLFFILSGFLITWMLMEAKGERGRSYFIPFYYARACRILPLYFFYLLVATLILFLIPGSQFVNDPTLSQSAADLKSNYPFLLSFTYNFKEIINYLLNRPYNGSIFFGHLWTLSVEVQFYLVFPLLVYFMPIKYLKRLLVAAIILVPFLRLIAVLLLQKNVTDLFWIGNILYNATLFQFDSLALGAALAIFKFPTWLQYGRRVLWILIIVALIVGLCNYYFLYHYFELGYFSQAPEKSSLGFDVPVYHLLTQTDNVVLNNRYFYCLPIINSIFATLVLLAINGKLASGFFENRLLVKIGRISYGIYIYHLVVSYLYESLLKKVAVVQGNIYLESIFMLLYFGLLYTLAWFSYNYFEKFFLNLRKLIPRYGTIS